MEQNIIEAAQITGQEHSSLSLNLEILHTHLVASLFKTMHYLNFKGNTTHTYLQTIVKQFFPCVNKSSKYQLVSLNQTAHNQSLLLNAMAAQETSSSHLEPGTPITIIGTTV